MENGYVRESRGQRGEFAKTRKNVLKEGVNQPLYR
jgi:hypothetical protein